jgi:hypothetical protein
MLSIETNFYYLIDLPQGNSKPVPKNTDTVKTEFNIRQSEINDELTPNPAYGTIPFRSSNSTNSNGQYQIKNSTKTTRK